MRARVLVCLAGALLLAFSLLPMTAKADVSNQAMEVTFQQPVRIPGQVLPPGTYWFTVPTDVGGDSNLNIVRISNADGTKVIADLNTVTEDPAQFGQQVTIDGVRWPTGKAVMTLAEGTNGSATLLSWYYPGRIDGHSFIYSSRRESQLKEENHVTLASRPGDTIMVGSDLASFE